MADAPKTVTIWDGILDDELTPNARTEAAKEAVESNLAEFDKHNEVLLAVLRNVYEKEARLVFTIPGTSYKRARDFEPFDADKAWRRLTRLAQGYFLRQVTPPAADRVARLRKLAEALGQARCLAESARQDHFGSDLFSVWFDGLPPDPRGQVVLDKDGSLNVVYFPEIDFKKMVATLDGFQAAALRAAKDVPTKVPGPAPFLPTAFIGGLADAYLELTGRKPGAGRGPFARFVVRFRAALDPSYKIITDENGRERVDESVIDVIKNALRHWRHARGDSTK